MIDYSAIAEDGTGARGSEGTLGRYGRREFLKLTTAFGVVLITPTALAACGGSEGAAEELSRLVVASGTPEVTLDPGTSFDGSSILVWRGPYETLLKFKGETIELEPHLAESFDVSADQKTYTLKMRSDVKFHDGEPFDAAAAQLNIERIRDLKVGLGYLFDEATFEIPDPMTLVITLNAFQDGFLSGLASAYAPYMISPKAIEKGDDFVRSNMVGTGPYRLESYTQNERVAFTLNPDYWQKSGGEHFQEVIVRYVTDASTLRLQLESGDIDVAFFLPDDTVRELSDSADIEVTDFEAFSTYIIQLSAQEGDATADPRVRQAIAYGFNYGALINDVLQGKAQKAHGILAPGFPGYAEDVPEYAYDPVRAKELLAAAGRPDGGFTIKYVYESGFAAVKRPLGELFQSNMNDLGITVELQEVSPAAWADLLSNEKTARGHSTAFLSGGTLLARPHDILFLFFHTKAQGASGLNWMYYSNQEYDSVVDEALNEPDSAKRDELYARAQQILAEDSPALFIYHQNYNLPLRDDVKGYSYNPMYILTLPFYTMAKA